MRKLVTLCGVLAALVTAEPAYAIKLMFISWNVEKRKLTDVSEALVKIINTALIKDQVFHTTPRDAAAGGAAEGDLLNEHVQYIVIGLQERHWESAPWKDDFFKAINAGAKWLGYRIVGTQSHMGSNTDEQNLLVLERIEAAPVPSRSPQHGSGVMDHMRTTSVLNIPHLGKGGIMAVLTRIQPASPEVTDVTVQKIGVVSYHLDPHKEGQSGVGDGKAGGVGREHELESLLSGLVPEDRRAYDLPGNLNAYGAIIMMGDSNYRLSINKLRVANIALLSGHSQEIIRYETFYSRDEHPDAFKPLSRTLLAYEILDKNLRDRILWAADTLKTSKVLMGTGFVPGVSLPVTLKYPLRSFGFPTYALYTHDYASKQNPADVTPCELVLNVSGVRGLAPEFSLNLSNDRITREMVEMVEKCYFSAREVDENHTKVVDRAEHQPLQVVGGTLLGSSHRDVPASHQYGEQIEMGWLDQVLVRAAPGTTVVAPTDQDHYYVVPNALGDHAPVVRVLDVKFPVVAAAPGGQEHTAPGAVPLPYGGSGAGGGAGHGHSPHPAPDATTGSGAGGEPSAHAVVPAPQGSGMFRGMHLRPRHRGQAEPLRTQDAGHESIPGVHH